MQQRDSNATDIAVIGGGASGLLVAIQLLSQPMPPSRIAIVEPRGRLGQGAAYSTPCPEHLLNVVAGRMSAFDSDPEHFVRFLASESKDTPREVIATTFARRMDYGRYLLATLEAHPNAGALQWVRDEAIDLENVDSGYVIRLRSDDTLRAERVVLAVGNAPRGIPLPAFAITGDPRIGNAWDYAAIREIPTDADVCVIGSGLSMVDVAVSLAANGHRGRVLVLSRHGLMPLSHASPGTHEGGVDELLPMSVRERMTALRQRAAQSLASGTPWQWTMDRLRDHGQALWQHLDNVEQRRFLRHAARFWDIHRHRIAPEIFATLDAMRASGQLQVHAGRLRSIAGGAHGTDVRFVPRHAHDEQVINVRHVINATGVETNIDRLKGGLLGAMRDRGFIRPGPHGIGVETDAHGALVGTDGLPAANLRTLGAVRIGSLWESIAIPELRGQAQRLAEILQSG